MRQRGRAGRAHVVPLGRDGADRYVPWILAPMVYLACLALAVALSTAALAERWDRGLSGAMTVELPGTLPADERPDTLAAIMEILTAWPGVAGATVLDDDAIGRLLAPWLGPDANLGDLPVPVLIDVTLAGEPAVDPAALEAALAEAAPGALVDDHGQWRRDLLTVATTVKAVAAAFILLAALSMMAAVIFATRAGFAIHRPVIDLLHLMGATDSYVARQFQGHALRLAVRGAVAGTLLALATLVLLQAALPRGGGGLLPSFSLDVGSALVLLAVPAAAALLAAISARIAVRLALSRIF
ncbi:hypothetical protein [Inquilinus sp. CAU 1745]|uniref:cell division protein FtsX n=1 Tax=Inquilinus sp. CAU 1745 TaxID=3140369 RepID=UPI00325B2C0F